LDESLRLFKGERLFTGSWSENETRRRTRTSGTLAFIAESFDPGKCANGTVNVGKYDAWAKSHFPNGFQGRNRKGMTEDGQIVETESGVHVGPEFIAVFLAVCEFALLTDKNQDGTLPHNRARDIWDVLYAKGVVTVRFCPRKWLCVGKNWLGMALCRSLIATIVQEKLWSGMWAGTFPSWVCGRGAGNLDFWDQGSSQ
jgi:hypothetical protein